MVWYRAPGVKLDTCACYLNTIRILTKTIRADTNRSTDDSNSRERSTAMHDKPKRPGFAFWATALVVVVLLYVLSSGPTRMVAVRRMPEPPFQSETPRRIEKSLGFSRETTSRWNIRLYYPLVWAAAFHHESWGKPVWWYWSLFPIRYV